MGYRNGEMVANDAQQRTCPLCRTQDKYCSIRKKLTDLDGELRHATAVKRKEFMEIK